MVSEGSGHDPLALALGLSIKEEACDRGCSLLACRQKVEKWRYKKDPGWDTLSKDTPSFTCLPHRLNHLLFSIPSNAPILWIIKGLGQSSYALPTSADSTTDTRSKQASDRLRLTITGEQGERSWGKKKISQLFFSFHFVWILNYFMTIKM